MPIRVNLPDGSVANFPDGMPPAEIEKALQAHHAQQPSANDSDFARMVLGQPKPANEWGRAAALTGRDVVEGVAGTAGIVTDPLIAGWNALTGRKDLDARSSAGALLDKIGAPRPESGAGRGISGGAARGSQAPAGLSVAEGGFAATLQAGAG